MDISEIRQVLLTEDELVTTVMALRTYQDLVESIGDQGDRETVAEVNRIKRAINTLEQR